MYRLTFIIMLFIALQGAWAQPQLRIARIIAGDFPNVYLYFDAARTGLSLHVTNLPGQVFISYANVGLPFRRICPRWDPITVL